MNQAAPHSVEAEQGVLGSMLLSPCQVIPECSLNFACTKVRRFEMQARAIKIPRLIQWPSGWLVCLIKQRIARLADDLERRRT
jgi:hypothetical protein